jgi:hypothetical protein
MSKAYWAKVDWQHFDQNEIFSGLEMKNRSQGFLVKAAQVQYRGAEMQLGLLNRSREQPRYPFALDFAVEPDKGETMTGALCKTFLAQMEAGLGKPSVKVEFPFRPDPNDSTASIFKDVTNVREEWDIGNSRIHVSCDVMDFAGGKSFGIFSLGAGEKSTEKADKPLAWVRCTQALTVTFTQGGAQSQVLPDVALVLDEYRGAVLSDRLRTISKTATFSETEIEFARESDTRSDHARINRVSGQYQEERIAKDGNGKGKIVGQCERIDPNNPKF